MPKIVIIGAGSGFGGRLSMDILSRENLQDSRICLNDIHAGRLDLVTKYVQRTAEKYNLPANIISDTDRRKILKDADFVITSVAVGGGAYWGYPFDAEINIPKKYGIDQSVADTVSVGAVFRFMRTAPVHLQIFRDIEELAPNAMVLNHTNPMCMLTWIQSVATNVTNIGLCHGVQGTSRKIAKLLDIPGEELQFMCAGINHLAWFLELTHKGQDIYPQLKAMSGDAEKIKAEKVRFEILKQFNYFSTESNKHDSEYLPYFRRTPELMEYFNLESRDVPDHAPKSREWANDTGGDDGQGPVGSLKMSHEYTSGIIEAVLTDVPYRFNGNVMNTGLITNLPDGCCVEVPCLVDANGVQPTYVGDLPSHLAGLNRTNINVQQLAVEAVLEKDREKAFYACALDPNAAALLPLHEIRNMFNEMWEAEQSLLKWFDKKHSGPVPEICAE